LAYPEMTNPTKTIFVTVGTTRFDLLVKSATSPVALDWMVQQGFTTLTIQYGRGVEPKIDRSKYGDGKSPPASSLLSPLTIQVYDFLPSLQEDMIKADLILSHAGAGTVMEALRMKKKLVVVINTLLMDNHQTELAGAMATRGHLIMVDEPEKLDHPQTWSSFDNFLPTPHQDGDDYDFPRLLDSFLGYSEIKDD
jgi:beta-1,4-N-acetylglucosaminyltransferase